MYRSMRPPWANTTRRFWPDYWVTARTRSHSCAPTAYCSRSRASFRIVLPPHDARTGSHGLARSGQTRRCGRSLSVELRSAPFVGNEASSRFPAPARDRRSSRLHELDELRRELALASGVPPPWMDGHGAGGRVRGMSVVARCGGSDVVASPDVAVAEATHSRRREAGGASATRHPRGTTSSSPAGSTDRGSGCRRGVQSPLGDGDTRWASR